MIFLVIRYNTQNAKDDLDKFTSLVRDGIPFTFVRFSDGEIEILRNRKLFIGNNITEFRGRVFNNDFPEFDRKYFDPDVDIDLRKDLLSAATFSDENYFKGIPTAHNDMLEEREFLLRLNGRRSHQMTFADLFLNSNFVYARTSFFPVIIDYFENISVVGNFRCELRGELKNGILFPIPDNLFSQYHNVKMSTMSLLEKTPRAGLVLSSASSLSNILGKELRQIRPDITFIDIGTALNDLLGLPMGTRAYHKLINPRGLRQKFQAWRYKRKREYKLRW